MTPQATRHSILLLLLLFLSTSATLAQRDVAAYIQRYDSVAVDIMLRHQVPASLVLALAIHESGAGTSRLSREQCNHFGLKGKRGTSKKKPASPSKKHLEFETDEASFQHFAELVTRKKFYDKLKGNPDPVVWLKALKKAGYAASPHWVPRVSALIRRHQLTTYDRPLAELMKSNTPEPDSLESSLPPLP